MSIQAVLLSLFVQVALTFALLFWMGAAARSSSFAFCWGSRFMVSRMSYSENRFPLFRDMR